MVNSLFLLGLAILPADKKTETAVALPMVKLVLPKDLNGLEYRGRVGAEPDQKPDPFVGVQLHYSAPNGLSFEASAYTRGVEKIPDGRSGKPVKAEFDRLVGHRRDMAKEGVLKDFKVVTAELPVPKALRDGFAQAAFTSRDAHGANRTVLFVGGRAGHFVKVEVKQRLKGGKEDDEWLKGVLEEVAKGLK
jgi:hypothetical protein